MLPDSTGEPHKSYREPGSIYFWTATINGWKHLLRPDSYKDEIIGSLHTLSGHGKIDVSMFKMTPDHIHLIRYIKALNRKG